MKARKIKSYLILLGYLICIGLGFIISFILEYGSEYPLYSAIYLLAVIPVALIIYGIISYLLTQNVFFPNLMLFIFGLIVTFMYYTVLVILKTQSIDFMYYIIGPVILAMIPSLVTTAISLITMLISRIFKATKKK